MNITAEIISNSIGSCNVRVREGRPSDVTLFELELSEADRFELGCTSLRDWKKELHGTFEHTEEFFIVAHDKIPGALAFGVTRMQDSCGLVWMLQTQSFRESLMREYDKWRLFLSGSRLIVKILASKYVVLYNFIPDSQKSNIKWLKSIGFTFVDAGHGILFFWHKSRCDFPKELERLISEVTFCS